MAPNLNRNALLLAPQAFPLAILQQAKDYQAPQPVVDSESYWSWPSEDAPVDVFLADHIAANLQQAAASSTSSFSAATKAEHDSYWAEEEQPQAVVAVSDPLAPPQQEEASANCNYWDEPCHARTSSDVYWAEQEQQPDSSSYWCETQHALTASDAYYWSW